MTYNAIVDLVAWLVVYPLLLFITLMIYRVLYRQYMREKRRRDRVEATRRNDENARTIEETLKPNKKRN